MLKLLSDGKCERWFELWSHSYFYDDKCNGCKFIITLGGRNFCSKTEGGRVGLHQVIRSQIGCAFCKNYVKKLDAECCLKCLRDYPDAPVFEMYKVNDSARSDMI